MKNFQSLFLIIGLGLIAGEASGADIATCSNPSGHAYYAHRAPIQKDKSGWTEDAITGGLVTIKRVSEGKYDIMFVDAFKSIRSARAEGGTVIGVRRSSEDAIFVIMYAEGTVETYHLLRDDQGKNIYLSFLDRGAEGQLAKASLMMGICSAIDFDSID
jgi:hypothetical protein